MSKEEFNKLWKDSTKEQILNQYYYDYEEMIKSHNIMKEVRKYIDKNGLFSVDTYNFCNGMLKILDKENQDDKN